MSAADELAASAGQDKTEDDSALGRDRVEKLPGLGRTDQIVAVAISEHGKISPSRELVPAPTMSQSAAGERFDEPDELPVDGQRRTP